MDDSYFRAIQQLSALPRTREELLEQERHRDIMRAQSEQNLELQRINRKLQEQIDQTQKELEESKLENKRIAKRSWKQFWISFAVSIVSVVISIAALYFSRK